MTPCSLPSVSLKPSSIKLTFPYLHFQAFDSPAETTVLAFLKSVLFQLLERNVGDVKLYARLVEAFDSYHHKHNNEELEASLWSAWEIGLRTVNHSLAELVIVVDGFDSLPGDGKPQAFHKKLHDSISKFKTIRAVTLSRPMSHLSSGSKHLSISASHIAEDIRTFLNQSFATAGWFTALNAEERDHLIDDLAKHAKDSFLWAYLASRLVKGKTSSHSLGSLDDLLHKVMQRIDIKNQTTKDLLLFLLVAKRPLSVDELAELLSVNFRAHTSGPVVNVKKHIADHCSDIVVVVNNRVHYRSLQIRQYLDGLLGKSLPSKKDAQLQFTAHLLLCAKLRMPANYQPSFEVLGHESVRETLSSHAILDYAVHHWVDHLQLSSAYRDNGELKVTNDLRAVFPDSVLFALLERSCWHANSGASLQKILPRHEFALKVREACFGEKHIVVLQSLIILANVNLAFAAVTQSELRGVKFFYRASRLGRAILSSSDPVVIACVDRFLHYTATLKFTTRTEIVTYREELLYVTIDISRTKYGPNSDAVIHWYNVLLELYISIREEHNIYIIRQKLCEIYIIVYGPKSPQVRDVLKVLLKKDASWGEIVPLDDFGFDTGDDDGEDEVDILVLLGRAASYEKHCKWTFAEKIYVMLWRRIALLCRVQATVEFHVLKLKIAIQYARFLRERKRIEEASNILVCLWAEYEKVTFDSLEIIILMREVAVLFKAFGLLEFAVKVCGWVWGWFKGKGKAHDGEADKVTILVTEIIEEITETTVTTKTTTTTTIETTETVMKEVYVTHYERCRHSKVDTVFLKSCIALLSLYVQQQNWAQVEIVAKQTLEITWKAMFSVDVKIKLTEHHIHECIAIARQLAVCYHQQRRFELAEQTYLRLFYACIHSLKLDDASVAQVTLVLIAFYEEYHRHDKIIEIYIMLLDMHRKQLGAAHHRTIDILYALAGQCRLLGRKDAYVYYKEIVTVVNKGHKHCQRHAFDAAVILCGYYHAEKMWSELQAICYLLWETFLHHHHHQECAFTEEIIQVVYERYLYVLEVHAKVEYSVLYKLSVQYRETVILVFGAAASIVILALIALAKICERHETHHHESVTIYEEVIKKISTTKTITTTVTETTVTTVKKRLSKMYVTIITTGSSGTVATTTIERAIQLCLEAYLQLKVEFGCWHETTLAKLKDIVILYQKLATAEARVKIIELVQAAVIEIITTAKVTIALYNAATTLASIYVLANLTQEAHALVHQLHHLLIFGDSFPSSEITLKFSVFSSATPASLIFLVGFEQHLHQKITRTGSEIMATIALETFLYKQYQLTVEANTDIVATLTATANLRAFWEETRQTQFLVVLDKRIFALFKTHYASSIKTGDDSVRIFYIALLQGLASSRAAGPDFALVACRAANKSVKSLLDAGKFKLGLEVAQCASQFAIKQGFYRRHDGMAYGYKLAEYLVGIEAKRPTDTVLQRSMSEMSLAITKEVLETMRAEKINFVGLSNDVLSGLVRLFGVQENWSELAVSFSRHTSAAVDHFSVKRRHSHPQSLYGFVY
jgi:tetratricopeptide (TPR) repeat protein